MEKAFVLGAGLGTRLRPLTDRLPKPLVPVFHRPLIAYAFDHLRSAGVREFVVNTHHCHDAYRPLFPGGRYDGCPITLRHEPVLLETAGGIANVADLFLPQLRGGGSFFVYNGDILTDLPLAPAAAQHRTSGDAVTLVLRSSGPALHIAVGPGSNKAIDIRDKLGTGCQGTHQFTGIYLVRQEFLDRLTPGKIESVIPIFLDLIREGRVGTIVEDRGIWRDLGSRDTYLDAHRDLASAPFPTYANAPNGHLLEPIHPDSKIDPSAQIDPFSVVGPQAEVGAGAVLTHSILWPGAKVAPGSVLHRCIVRDGHTASGVLSDSDI